MNYILPPEPADDEVIYPDRGDGKPFTWADHRAMEKTLRDMERDNQDIKAARQQLDATLEAFGFNVDDWKNPDLVCEFCGKSEMVRHKKSCQMYLIDAPVTREAGGYQYYDEFMELIDTTSVPMTDEEAFDYFRIVSLMFPRNPDLKVKFIFKREIGDTEYKIMPVQYDSVTKEVIRLG